MITFNKEALKDKIHACFIGKNIGGTIGAPTEGCTEVNNITGFTTPPGKALPNDDLDLQLVWLKAMEEHSPFALTAQILSEYWISFIPANFGEYGLAKNNLRIGLLPPLSGEYKNGWKNSNGAWIRTEVWACMAPGCPDVAVKYAQMDAMVDHGCAEGTYAAMFVAALQSAAFVISDIRDLIELSLTKIPEACRVAQSIRLVLDCRDKGLDRFETRELIVKDSEDLGWFQAPANVAFTVLGLLWGEGNFKKSMIYAVNCGDDTDCTAATVGSTLGILYGTAGIPEDWSAYIGDDIVTICIDHANCRNLPDTCTALCERIYNQIDIVARAHKSAITLGDADIFPEEDISKFSDDTFSKELCEIPGNSYAVDMIWADCRVVLPDGPEIEPCKPIRGQLIFKNKHNPAAKHLELCWHLPEGWQIEGTHKYYFIGEKSRCTKNTVAADFTLIPPASIKATNRVIVEVTSPMCPTAGLVPIILIG